MQTEITAELVRLACWQKQTTESCLSIKQLYRFMPIMPSIDTTRYLSFKKNILSNTTK